MLIKTRRKKITSPEAAAQTLYAILRAESEADQDKEHVWCIGLTASGMIRYVDLVSLGTITESHAQPRDIFRLAITTGAHHVILGHNHPGGEARPSENDIAVTNRIRQAGEILGIALYDHIIIGEYPHFTSLKEEGYLSDQSKGG